MTEIKNGKYVGFGFFDVNETGRSYEIIHDSIDIYPDNREVHQIIKTYLKKNKVEKIIKF